MESVKITFKNYLPLFLLMCFSGNPLFTATDYSKTLLVVYTFCFIAYMHLSIRIEVPDRVLKILVILVGTIVLITLFQYTLLGSVSIPGVFAIILKIIIGAYTLLYYQDKKIDFLTVYIKIIAFLVIVSLPFWLYNHLSWFGLDLHVNNMKTVFIYTSLLEDFGLMKVRNPGMFWEPGAFSGYLILGLVFVILRNKKYELGDFKMEVFWIFIGVLTTMSTTGFLVLCVISNIYVYQHYGVARIIILPISIFIVYLAYYNLDFMQEKIVNQYEESHHLDKGDISNTRFGSWKMDMQYIQSMPFTGNGLDSKTRFRFHPWITKDIGNGNGMSNTLVCWGIPFFLFWLFSVYKSVYTISRSVFTTITLSLVILLLLQGEQYLNYPVFLLFFVIPYIYKFKTIPAKDFNLL